MGAKFIPAINVDSFEELERRVRLLEKIALPLGVDMAHIDVADGTFTENTIWHDARELAGFETSLKLEVHLMLADIDHRIEEWLAHPVSRVIFHIETSRDPMFVIGKCREAQKKVLVALHPKTPAESSRPFWAAADGIQLLSVIPGLAGQAMLPDMPEKIATLRRGCPSCIIEVDGGVTVENARSLLVAGANELVAASAVFGADKPADAIAQFIRELA